MPQCHRPKAVGKQHSIFQNRRRSSRLHLSRAAKGPASDYQRKDSHAFHLSLSILWLDKNIAVGVDQEFQKGLRSPVTEYFFWPRIDAWEELRRVLDEKAWIPDQQKAELLNRVTEVISYWQQEARPTLESARHTFKDCRFQGV